MDSRSKQHQDLRPRIPRDYDLFGLVTEPAQFSVTHERASTETSFANPGVRPCNLASHFNISGDLELRIFNKLFSGPTADKNLLETRQAELLHIQYISQVYFGLHSTEEGSGLDVALGTLQVAARLPNLREQLTSEVTVNQRDTTYYQLLLEANPEEMRTKLEGWTKNLSGIKEKMNKFEFMWPQDPLDSILLVIALKFDDKDSLLEAAKKMSAFQTQTTKRIGDAILDFSESHADLNAHSYLELVLSEDRGQLEALHNSFERLEYVIHEGIVLTKLAAAVDSPNWCRVRYVADGEQQYKQGWNAFRELECTITNLNYESDNYGSEITVRQNRYDSPRNSKIRIFTGGQATGKSFFLETEDGIQICSQVIGFAPAHDADVVLYSYYGSFPRAQGNQRAGLSAYGSEIANVNSIVDIVEALKPDELAKIAIDEIGSTTDPHEGGALAAALLKHLAERNVTVTVSTHYDALKKRMQGDDSCVFYHIVVERGENGLVSRSIVEGIGDSNALEAAKTTELQPSITEKAARILEGEAPALRDRSIEVEFVDYDPSAREILAQNAELGWSGFFPEVRNIFQEGVLERWGFFTSDLTLKGGRHFFSVDAAQAPRELAEKLLLSNGPVSTQEWFERRRLFAELTDDDGRKYHELTRAQSSIANLIDACRHLNPELVGSWFQRLNSSFFEYALSSSRNIEPKTIAKFRELHALAEALWPDEERLKEVPQCIERIERLTALARKFVDHMRDSNRFEVCKDEFHELFGLDIDEHKNDFYTLVTSAIKSEGESLRTLFKKVVGENSHNGLDLTKEIIEEKLKPFLTHLETYPELSGLSGSEVASLCMALCDSTNAYDEYLKALSDIDSIYMRRCALQLTGSGSPLPEGITSGVDLARYLRERWVGPGKNNDEDPYGRRRYRAPELSEQGMQVFMGQHHQIMAVQLIARQILDGGFCKGEPSHDGSIRFLGTFTPGYEKVYNSSRASEVRTPEVRDSLCLNRHNVSVSGLGQIWLESLLMRYETL